MCTSRYFRGGSPVRLLFPFLFALLLVATAPGVNGQRGLFERPGAGAGPTPVQVGIYVNDVLKVDGAEQLVTVDFFVIVRWHDPTLATGQPRAIAPSEAWNPNAIIANEGRLFPRLPQVVEVDGEGNAKSTQHYVGTLTNRLSLQEFPFDHQTFGVEVVLPSPQGEVQVTEISTLSGQRPQFSLTDWDIEAGRTVPYLYEFAPTSEVFPGIVYEIPARRRLAFYLWKGMVPLGLVVLMACSVFWIERGQMASRMSVAVTSMLTLIAYRFLLGSLLPRLSYLTRMDWYTLSCTTVVFAALLVVVYVGRLGHIEREGAAERVDKTARWLFPLVFGVCFTACFFR